MFPIKINKFIMVKYSNLSIFLTEKTNKYLLKLQSLLGTVTAADVKIERHPELKCEIILPNKYF